MKPDYKNWFPKGMMFSLIAGTALSLALLLVFGPFGLGVSGKLCVVLGVVFGVAFVVCAKYTEWCVYALSLIHILFVAAMLHTPLSLPFNYLYNRLVKGTDSPLAAVADRAPLAAVGMTLAVVAVSALGALIGIKIARELKKSGVLKK